MTEQLALAWHISLRFAAAKLPQCPVRPFLSQICHHRKDGRSCSSDISDYENCAVKVAERLLLLAKLLLQKEHRARHVSQAANALVKVLLELVFSRP